MFKKFHRLTLNKASLFIWLLFSICMLFPLNMARAIDACSSYISDQDYSTVKLITENDSTSILKSSTFVVLINNDNSKNPIKWEISITKDGGKNVFQKSGQLDAYGGKNTIYQEGIITSSWDTGNYQIQANIIHATLNCILQTKKFNLTLTGTADDIKPAAGIQTADTGNFAISLLDPKIGVGDTFRITIANNLTSDVSYEILVNDLKTGNFVRKRAGTVTAKSQIGDWAEITTAGDHKTRVNIYDPATRKVLDSKDFSINVAVGNNTNMKVPPAETTTTDSEAASSPGTGSSSAVLNANLDVSQPVTHSVSEKVNPTIGEILSGIFGGGDDPTEANLDSVSLLIKKVLEYAFNFAGIVAFIMILWAARIFLNSYGSDESAAMGKKTLLWAFIGLCVIIIGKGILLWVYSAFSS